MKSVSVIIPNYNNAHYLNSAITSVLNQTFTDYEIIVVDDGSTDNSREVVSAFGDKVRYIWQENKGLGGARNTGIRASESEFIGLLDADDEWQPDFLEKMMVLARIYPQSVVYYCAAQSMDSSGHDLPQIFGRKVSSDEIYLDLLRANFIIPSTVILRRSAALDVGLFEENTRDLHGCEDWDLWLRLSPLRSFAGTAESLVRYRVHGKSLSANFDSMSSAKRNVIIKNFGPDDGNSKNWSLPKRLAYAGLYRRFLINSIQRHGDWQGAVKYLRKAFLMDSSNAGDINLFYELAFGEQPMGYRGSAEYALLETNAQAIMHLLDEVFQTDETTLLVLESEAYSVACCAIGLAAYNTGYPVLSRKYLWRAGWIRPALWFSSGLLLLLMKSFISRRVINRLHHFKTT